MGKKTLLFLSLLTVLASPAYAREYWNGTECVTCPEPKEYAGGPELNEPSSGGGAGASIASLTQLLNTAPMESQTLHRDTEDQMGAVEESSLLYVVVGPVRKVDVDRHHIVVQNRRNRKNEKIYVYDPILPSLSNRNVVEVWLKPGSDKAEKINRIA